VLYRFPATSQPTVRVVTLPKLRRMMCIGTEILKAKAQLLSMLTEKKRSAMVTRRCSGTRVGLRGRCDHFEEEEDGDEVVDTCEGRAKRDVRMN